MSDPMHSADQMISDFAINTRINELERTIVELQKRIQELEVMKGKSLEGLYPSGKEK